MRGLVADAGRQIKSLRTTYALVIVATAAVLMAVATASLALDVKLSTLIRDPLAVVEASPMVGFLSNLGIVLWSASAGVCYLATLTLWRGDRMALAWFFFWSGMLTTLLTLDDLFQLHEAVIPSILGRGQRAMMIAYIGLVAVYVWRFRKTLLDTDYTLLVASGVGFCISIGVDLVPHVLWRGRLEFILRLAEDGGKFLGIAFWLAFFLSAGAAALGPAGQSRVGPATIATSHQDRGDS